PRLDRQGHRQGSGRTRCDHRPGRRRRRLPGCPRHRPRACRGREPEAQGRRRDRGQDRRHRSQEPPDAAVDQGQGRGRDPGSPGRVQQVLGGRLQRYHQARRAAARAAREQVRVSNMQGTRPGSDAGPRAAQARYGPTRRNDQVRTDRDPHAAAGPPQGRRCRPGGEVAAGDDGRVAGPGRAHRDPRFRQLLPALPSAAYRPQSQDRRRRRAARQARSPLQARQGAARARRQCDAAGSRGLMRLLRVLVGFFFLAAGLAVGALNPQPVAIDLGFATLHATLGVAILVALLAGVSAGGLVLAVSVVLPLRSRLRRQGPCTEALLAPWIWFVLLLPAAALSGWVIGRRGGERHSDSQVSKLSTTYCRGLNYLLNEQPDKAIELFLHIAELDKDTFETQVALGHLFRRRGEVDRAIRLHQALVQRPDLTDQQKVQALLALGEDYMKSGLLDRAETVFTDLARIDQRAPQALRHLIAIYQSERDWAKAIENASRFEAVTGEPMGKLIAQFECELADRHRAAGDIDA